WANKGDKLPICHLERNGTERGTATAISLAHIAEANHRGPSARRANPLGQPTERRARPSKCCMHKCFDPCPRVRIQRKSAARIVPERCAVRRALRPFEV